MKFLRDIGRKLYKYWMAFARGLAIVNSTILLTIVYFVIIGPMYGIIRLLGKDLLSHRIAEAETFWKKKEPVSHTAEQARHQF